jgi:isoquinoline 1-oxidoreductase alpha subunit
MAIRFRLNDRDAEFAGDPAMPLLWFLRDHAGLTGTKYGCGVGACGACTVHLDGRAQRACVLPMAAIAGKRVATIEGVFDSGGAVAAAVRDAWIAADVPQCGWCQVGQVMSAIDLLGHKPSPSDADIAAITNLCRCGTYPRIRDAIRAAAERSRAESSAASAASAASARAARRSRAESSEPEAQS